MQPITLIADTSALYAALTDTHPQGEAIRRHLQAAISPIISPLVLAELDYLVATRIGVEASLTVIDELTSGAYDIVDITTEDIRSARKVIARYSNLNIGLTDAVNVVLADRYDTDIMLTLDQRHFRAVVPITPRYRAFTVLPADG